MSDLRYIFERIIQNKKFELREPATDEMIRNAEHELKIKLPKMLIDTLRISNGIIELMELPTTKERIPIEETLWSVESMLKLKNEDKNVPFLFFAGNGCGDYFCYKVFNDTIEDDIIFLYNPIVNEYEEAALDLVDWLTIIM